MFKALCLLALLPACAADYSDVEDGAENCDTCDVKLPPLNSTAFVATTCRLTDGVELSCDNHEYLPIGDVAVEVLIRTSQFSEHSEGMKLGGFEINLEERLNYESGSRLEITVKSVFSAESGAEEIEYEYADLQFENHFKLNCNEKGCLNKSKAKGELVATLPFSQRDFALVDDSSKLSEQDLEMRIPYKVGDSEGVLHRSLNTYYEEGWLRGITLAFDDAPAPNIGVIGGDEKYELSKASVVVLGDDDKFKEYSAWK